MRVIELLHDSERASETGRAIVDRVHERPEAVEEIDLGTGERADARREAMLSVGEATRIGGKPDAIFDEAGTPDFADGAIVTEDERGRRELHVGEDALDALQE
jgi:hypothetical protein